MSSERYYTMPSKECIAIQLTKNNVSEVEEFVKTVGGIIDKTTNYFPFHFTGTIGGFRVTGVMSYGDFIIKTSNGDVFPYTPSRFLKDFVDKED